MTLLSIGSCAQDPKSLTQLVLVADTDIAAVDSVRFVVRSDDGTRMEESTVQRGDAPAYVSVVRDEGPIGPLTVSAIGLVKGESPIARSHRVSFVPDQTRVVQLHLAASCLGTSCAPAETCSETGCVPAELTSEQLGSWEGEAPRIDALPREGGTGTDDAGTARDSAADAQAGDARVPTDAGNDARAGDAGTGDDAGVLDANVTQCDGGAWDLKTDPYHCGQSCSMAIECPSGLVSNTIRTCNNGNCCSGLACTTSNGGATCRRFYGNCNYPDLIIQDGCETYLADDKDNCGECGFKCSSIGKSSCVLGVCQ